MSFFEFLVICIVILFVVKAEDIPILIKQFNRFRNFIFNTKKEIMSHLNIKSSDIWDSNTADQAESVLDIKSELKQINYYLERISELGSEYRGEYSLPLIKNHYNRLMQEQEKARLLKNTDEQS